MRELMKRFKWFGLVLLAGLILGCAAPGLGNLTTGSVRLNLNHVSAKSILPPISMDPAEFLVTGAGPAGAAYGPELVTGSVEIDSLIPGEWAWTIVARNAAHNPIGLGDATCMIVIGQSVNCTVTIHENSEPGSFLLDLAWEPDIVTSPVWVGNLKDNLGIITPMPFTVDEATCTAASLVDPLHVGWFLMVVQLFDDTVLSTGAAAAVRIAAGRQTHGDLFLHAVQGSGQVDLLFDYDFFDELDLIGTPAFGPGETTPVDIYEGETIVFDVSASETISRFIYLNGTQVAVDAPFSLSASALKVGEFYRIDGLAFAGEKSGGSNTWIVSYSAMPPEAFGITCNAGISPYTEAGTTITFFILKAGDKSVVAEWTGDYPSFGGTATHTFLNLPVGTYIVKAAMPGYPTRVEWYNQSVTEGGATILSLPNLPATVANFPGLLGT